MRYPRELSKESEQESYEYFDKYVRPLPKKSDGTLDLERIDLQHNDIDAFRHAYVSGVFTYEYGKAAAQLAGWLNEVFNPQSQPGDENMDFWNNAVGRKLANGRKTRDALAKAIKVALDNGEMIISPSDWRLYEGAERQRPSTSVIVLEEGISGANESFFDLSKSIPMTRAEFIAEIEAGQYENYQVKHIGGEQYPVSRRDASKNNNLG